jgi:hypothetical protein
VSIVEFSRGQCFDLAADKIRVTDVQLVQLARLVREVRSGLLSHLAREE